MHICKKCNQEIPPTAVVSGKKRQSLTSRSYCLNCSPYGTHKGYELRRGTKLLNENEFIEVVKNATSIGQVIRKLGLIVAGGNYFTVKRQIKLLQLNTSHFTGQGHLKGKKNTWHPKIPLEKILVENSSYGGSTSKIKKRLLEEGVFERKCYGCNLIDWLGKLIPLELEHINGDRFDHRKENLTLLCPNCHALTPTYRRKKKHFPVQ